MSLCLEPGPQDIELALELGGAPPLASEVGSEVLPRRAEAAPLLLENRSEQTLSAIGVSPFRLHGISISRPVGDEPDEGPTVARRPGDGSAARPGPRLWRGTRSSAIPTIRVD
jgi:hypothetical protein